MSISATEMVRQLLKLNPNPTPTQIAEIADKVKKETGKGSKSLVYKVLRKMPKPAAPVTPTPEEPIVKVGEEEEIEVPPVEEEEEEEEIEEVEVSAEEPEERELPERLEVEMLNAEDLTYVWKTVNSLFPEAHQRPDKAMNILGKLWVKPANRLVQKYATENVDLYLAGGLTALTFLPAIIGTVKDLREKREEGR